MIDLETLDVLPSSIVISIGAVFFDHLKTGKIGEKFYGTLEIQDQLDKKRTISASTLKWWMNQPNEARLVFNEESYSPSHALHLFYQWVKQRCIDSKDLKVWGNGASFDPVIMEDLFRSYSVTIPWYFTGIRDLRTFKEYVANNAKLPKPAHHALKDAIAQAQYMIDHTKRVEPSEMSDEDRKQLMELEENG